MELMHKLEQIRQDRGETIETFAKSLGVTREHYHMMLNGTRGVGEKLRGGVLSRFPELAEQVIASFHKAA
jgi:hypothetical protein